MNKQNFDIDKLINSARGDKPVFSLDDARHLIENSESILSVREIQLKKIKGVILMNLIASVIVAAAAVGYLTVSADKAQTIGDHSAQTAVSKNTIIAAGQNPVELTENQSKTEISKNGFAANSENAAKPVDKIIETVKPAIINDDFAANEPQSSMAMKPLDKPSVAYPQQPSNKLQPELGHENPVTMFNQVNVKGVRLVEADQETLDKLGIKVDPDGRYIAVKLNKEESSYTYIYVDWGVKFDVDDKSNIEAKEVPNLITDKFGNRRLMSFENDNMSALATQDKDKLTDPKVTMTTARIDFNDKSNHDESYSANSKMNYSIQMDTMNHKISVFKTTSDSPNGQINVDEEINTPNFKLVYSNSDSCNEHLKELNQHLADLKKVFSDSLSALSNLQDIQKLQFNIIKQMKNFNLNTDTCNSGFKIKTESKIKIMNNGKDAPAGKIDNPNVLVMDMNFDNLIDINKLVPVKVNVPNAKDRNGGAIKNFSFILWYKPTDLFINELPQSVKQELKPELALINSTGDICEQSGIAGKDTYLDVWRSCSGSVENLKTYPNPAENVITVDFNLKEARQLSISLNDLNGRHIMTFADGIFLPAGEITRNFNLTGLEPGMYLVVVSSDCGEHAVQRIIKQ